MGTLFEAARSLRRSPSFTIAAAGSLGLAIGLACAVFTVAHAIFFSPPPYASPQTLVELWQTDEPGSEATQDYLQPERMHQWIDLDWRTMEAVAVSGLGSPLVEQGPDGPRRVWASPIAGDWFAVMGVDAARGRVLTAADVRPEATPALVVSDRFHRERDDAGIGQSLTLAGTTFTIVGVMPASFTHESRVWLPVAALPVEERPVAYAGVGRLRGGQSVEAAKEEVHRRSQTDIADEPTRFGGFGVTAKLWGAQARGGDRPALWMLTGVVGAVLLLGLSNLTQLFIGRAQARAPGLAVRAAMGGSPWQIGRGLAAEGALVGLLGSSLGAVLAHPGVNVVVAFLSARYPFETDPRVGLPAVLLALALGTLAAVVIGVEPVRRAGSLSLQNLLQRRAGGSVSTKSERRTRNVMVAIQVATSLVLTAVAGVLVSAYRALEVIDVGYDDDRVVQALPDYEISGMRTGEQWDVVVAALEGLESDPRVSGTAAWQNVGQDYPPTPEGNVITDGPEVELEPSQELSRYTRVIPGTLEALGISIVEGRSFSTVDGPGSEPVVIVSLAGATALWPGESAIGRQLRFGEQGPWMTVVGVAEDGQLLRELGRTVAASRRPPMPMAFVPLGQLDTPPSGWREFGCCAGVVAAVRAQGDTEPVVRLLRTRLATVAPDLPLLSVGTIRDIHMAGYVGGTLSATGSLVGVGAFVALVLALVGIVGVVSEGLARRRPEFGLRIALGGSDRHLLVPAAMEALTTAGAGLAIGLAAVATVHLTASELIFDYYVLRLSHGLLAPGLLGISAVAITLTVLSVTMYSARRVLTVDPAISFRA